MSQPSDMYAEQLRSLCYGHALWQADPFGEYDRIRPGTAGFIFDGKFKPKWEMPWPSGPHTVETRIDVLKPLHSGSVRQSKVQLGVQASDPTGLVSGGAELKYECHRSKGAILSLKDQYMNSSHLEPGSENELSDYVCDHIDEILSKCGLRDQELRLVVITGVSLTGDWNAALVCGSDNRGLEFKGGVGIPFVEANTSVRYQKHEDYPIYNSSGHHHPNEAPCSETCKETKNQCVFIRRLQVRKKSWRKKWRGLLSAVASDSSPSPSIHSPSKGSSSKDSLSPSAQIGNSSSSTSSPRDDESNTTETDSDIIISSDWQGDPDTSLEDEIFSWMFQRSDAELAILYERDIERWLSTDVDKRHFSINVCSTVNGSLVRFDNCSHHVTSSTTPREPAVKQEASTSLSEPLLQTSIHAATRDDGDFYKQFMKYPSLLQGKKKGLLIACTYQHAHTNDPTMPPLECSHKDATNLKRLLLEHGYKEEDITILVDVGDDKETYPTRLNIIKYIQQLVKDARAGDSLFIHFSGHGDQYAAEDDKFEIDGMDELIYPCDYYELRQEKKEYFILDNLLRELLVDPLPEGCRLLALFDCSSSGTILDLPMNDDSEGYEASAVSATDVEQNSIEKSLTWKTRVSRGQTLQVDKLSGLTFASTLTEEPTEDCSATYQQVDKSVPSNVFKLRRGARQEWKSRSLELDPPPNKQGHENEPNKRLIGDLMVKKVQARQTENQRSQSLPIHPYVRHLQDRGTVHLLPLMDHRGTEDVSEEVIKNTKVPIDTRVINADVLCIASCRDDGRTYATSSGGVLVQAFCAVIDAAKRDDEVLTLKDLKCALRERLENIHIAGVKSMMKQDSSIRAEDYDVPIPQFSYSRTYDSSSIFTMS